MKVYLHKPKVKVPTPRFKTLEEEFAAFRKSIASANKLASNA